MKRRRYLLLSLGSVVLLSCSDYLPMAPDERVEACRVPASSHSVAPAGIEGLDALFEAAAREFGVPAELLKAIGYVETRWQMVEGHPEFPGQPAAYGIMALKGAQVTRGAELTGAAVAEVRTLPAVNLRAAAALLRDYADELGIDSLEPGAWAPAVARYSMIELPAGRAAYVHDDVYATLRQGVAREEAPAGNASLAAADVTPAFEAPAPVMAAGAPTDHAAAVWRSSPNFNARPAGDIGRVAVVVIHTCEGSYTGCWSWLANPDSRVSAHYVVREDGSEITQLVREADRGWHIGSNYDCGLNQGSECWRNGHSNNHFTIGIEHAGYASQSFWPRAQLDASARLVCDLTRRHGISRDDIRILGHAQLQPHNRTDPGANWPWAEFYGRIHAHCGDAAADEVIIDSNNQNNDAARGYIRVPDRWIATSQTPGFYGSGYFFASTGTTADPAAFHFHLPAPATRSIEAWWTHGPNRSPAARYIAVDAAGRQLGSVHTDQQRNGGRWNTLGSWHFPAGWNSIQLSRAGPAGCVVIADAIRVR